MFWFIGNAHQSTLIAAKTGCTIQASAACSPKRRISAAAVLGRRGLQLENTDLPKALDSAQNHLLPTAPLHRSKTKNSLPPQNNEEGSSQLQNSPQGQLSLLFRLFSFPCWSWAWVPFLSYGKDEARTWYTSCLLFFVAQTASQGSVTYDWDNRASSQEFNS